MRVIIAVVGLLGLLFLGPVAYWNGVYMGLFLTCLHDDTAGSCSERTVNRLLTGPKLTVTVPEITVTVPEITVTR